MNKWQRRWKRVRNVPGLSRDLVAVVAVIAVGAGFFGFVLVNLRFTWPWQDQLTLTADFTSADALNPGMAPKVRIAGVEVGQVTDVRLTEDGKARVTLSLDEDARVAADSAVVLRPKSVLNEMYVDIDPGDSGELLGDGDNIGVTSTVRPVQVDEVFADLDQRTREGLSDLLVMTGAGLTDAPRDLVPALQSFNRAELAFQPVLSQLERRRARIAKLVTALSDVARATGKNRARTERLVKSLETTLGVLSDRQDELVRGIAELPGLSSDLQASTRSVTGLADVLRPTLDDVKEASGDLPPTLRRLESTVANARVLLADAGPLVDKARPFVTVLGPVVGDLRASAAELAPATALLDPALDTLMPHLVDLRAFVFNTSGVFASSDATGGTIRGHVTVPFPLGALVPGTNGGHPSPLENGGAGS